MSKHDFFHSTPNDIDMFIKEYDARYEREVKMRAEEIEYSSWLNGVYVRIAVASALNGKKVKYPKKPLDSKNVPQNIVVTEEMSEEDKEKARQQFAENMQELFLKPNKKKGDS